MVLAWMKKNSKPQLIFSGDPLTRITDTAKEVALVFPSLKASLSQIMGSYGFRARKVLEQKFLFSSRNKPPALIHRTAQFSLYEIYQWLL